MLDRDLADRRGEERRRVVDEAVEAAEGRQRLLDQRRELGDVEEIGLDQRHRAGADVVELGLQQARFAGGAPEVDHQVRAGGVQAAADRRSHPSRATGNQHRLALHRKPSPAGIGAPPRDAAQDRVALRIPARTLGAVRRAHRTTFALRTPAIALGAARRAHAPTSPEALH